MTPFRELVDKACKRLDLSYAKLAARCGISAQYLCLLCGLTSRDLREGTAKKIAKGLGVSVAAVRKALA